MTHADAYKRGFLMGTKTAAPTVYMGSRPKPDGLMAEDIVDGRRTTGTVLADMVAPLAGDRAGRAEVMASSVGENPSFGVRRPQLQTLGLAAGGTVAGMLAGALTGGLAGKAFGQSKSDVGESAGTGGAIGAVTGGLAGLLMAALSRNKEISRISGAFDKSDKVTPNYRKANPVAAILGGTGFHSSGRTSALEAISGVAPAASMSPYSVAGAIAPAVPVVGGALQIGSGWMGAYDAGKRRQMALKRIHGYAPVSETGLFSRPSLA